MEQMLLDLLHKVTNYIIGHPHGVQSVTAVVSGICAIVILMLRTKAESSKVWAWWFGIAFVVFTISYSLQASLGYFIRGEWVSLEIRQGLDWVIRVIAAGNSCLTNVFFLAAARSLRDRRPIFPRWVWFFAAGMIGIVPESVCSFCRFPDAAFSIYCLGVLGYALATNISFRREHRQWLALLALGVAFLYALVQGVFAFHPLFVRGKMFISPETITVFAQSSDQADQLKFLDALAIAAILPLKLGLFLAGLVALLRLIIVLSSDAFNSMLAGVTSRRQRFLASRGFLRGIGQAVGADALELALRVPGDENKRVLIVKWEESGRITDPEVIPCPSEGSPIGRVLYTGEEVIWRGEYEYAAGILTRQLGENEKPNSAVAVPILFHGAVIGCLRIQARGRRGFGTAAISHIRAFAEVASLAAQSERELAAADQFGSRYARWRVKQESVGIERAIEEITTILQDVLSPLATILQLDIGFKSYTEIGGKGWHAKLLRENLGDGLSTAVERLKVNSAGTLDVLEINLYLLDVATDANDGRIMNVGKLSLIVPAGEDERFHPTLGTNFLLGRTIATLVTDALLDMARDHHAHLLKEFGVALNNRELVNHSQWFGEVEKAAKEGGLLWAVATQLEDDELFGKPEWREIVRHCLSREEAISNLTRLINLDHQVLGKHRVVSVRLPITNARIWFGVGREGFGPELETLSPWRIFLDRFSEIADSALLRLKAIIEMQRLQVESAQAQGLATVAVTTETLFHQLVNMVRDISNPVCSINDVLSAGELKTDEDTINLIKLTHQSANRLLDFAFNFMNVTRLDGHRPCSLLHAANQSMHLFEYGLRRNQITLDINVASDLIIDVPFHVASLAIANLVSNAKDAIDMHGGEIKIEAEDAGDMIHCYVTDNGPGIHPSVRDRLFEIGATTKRGSGGWGLYLVYRSLIENRGHIELTEPGPARTRFTIRFPKTREEI